MWVVTHSPATLIFVLRVRLPWIKMCSWIFTRSKCAASGHCMVTTDGGQVCTLVVIWEMLIVTCEWHYVLLMHATVGCIRLNCFLHAW